MHHQTSPESGAGRSGRPRHCAAPRPTRRRWLLGAALLGSLAAVVLGSHDPARAADSGPAGTVRAVQGEAHARPEETRARRPLGLGDAVHRGEVLTTGPAARLRLDLTGGGTLQLGANAAFVIDDLALGPSDSAPGSAAARTAMRLFSGPFRLIGDHTGGTVQTPLATLGIRGTDVWGGIIDRGFGVLLQTGIVDVITAGGTVTLDEPGEGVMVMSADAPPQNLVVWPTAKVARALATLALDGE